MGTDLVEVRRQFRPVFILVTGLYLIVFLISESISDYQFPDWLGHTHEISILLVCYAFHSWLFRFRIEEIDKLFLPAAEKAQNEGEETKKLTPIDGEILQRLEKFMQEDEVYHEPGITISSLAKQVDLQEYQLRRLINQHLGYRNFNTYLNQYRIKEATAILSDASKASIPILTIAMDIGFNSLAPFNRAFKASTGLPPRDYRKSKMS
jgi:AraC-like DNA-binding protein